MDAAEADAAGLREKLDKASTPEETTAVGKDLNALREKIDGLQTDFSSVAAGMDWRQVSVRKEEGFDTAHELEQLLRTIVLELKSLTSKPRETESLRATVSQQQKREGAMTSALGHLETQIAASEDAAVKERLFALGAGWSRQLEQIHNELSVAQFQLDKLLANERSVLSTLQSLTASFFRTRGRNLLFSVFTFLGVFVLARMARWYLLRWRLLSTNVRRSLAVRLLDIIYYVLRVMGAAAAGLSVLYASGDWVRLSDGTRGKVVALTPEWVQLVLLGGSRKTYPVAAFLAMNPENLSKNFRVRVRFGIDYRHQAECTKSIPLAIETDVKKGLREMLAAEDLKNLSVDFCEADSSSLDYQVLADFSGAVAARTGQFERTIQRLLVDSANHHGWTIPFQQLTVHQAK